MPEELREVVAESGEELERFLFARLVSPCACVAIHNGDRYYFTGNPVRDLVKTAEDAYARGLADGRESRS